MKEFKVFASIYDSPEKIDLNRKRDIALDVASCTTPVTIQAESVGDAYEKFFNDYKYLCENLDGKSVYPFYLDENGRICR